MTSPETPEFMPVEDQTGLAVTQLKLALLRLRQNLNWNSSNGTYQYSAYPLVPRAQALQPPQIFDEGFAESMNRWRINRTKKVAQDKDIPMNIFTIAYREPLLAITHAVPRQLFIDLEQNEDDSSVRKYLEQSEKRQIDAGLDRAEPIDYAIVDDALLDLGAFCIAATQNGQSSGIFIENNAAHFEAMRRNARSN